MVLVTPISATFENITGINIQGRTLIQEPWNGNLFSLLAQLSQTHMQLAVYQMLLSVFIYYMFSNQLSIKVFSFLNGFLKQSISILTLYNYILYELMIKYIF